MDLDGDGVLSMYEMEHFYKQQVKRMERRGIETLSVEDCLCQILDMVQPRVSSNWRETRQYTKFAHSAKSL